MSNEKDARVSDLGFDPDRRVIDVIHEAAEQEGISPAEDWGHEDCSVCEAARRDLRRSDGGPR